MAPAQLGYLRASFRFFQDRDDLLFAESSLLHVLALPSTRQTLTCHWDTCRGEDQIEHGTASEVGKIRFICEVRERASTLPDLLKYGH